MASLIVLTLVVSFSCVDPDKAPIVTYDAAGHGAYPRFVDESGALLVNIQSQAEFDASEYTYSIKFVDEKAGQSVTSYTLNISYVDVNGANSSGPKELRAYAASEFGTDAEGNKVIDNIKITSADVTSAFGLAYADLSPGDNFKITGSLMTESGVAYAGSNSSSTVKGAAFQGFFDYSMAVGCPSDLTGGFSVTTTLWCDAGKTTTVIVDIESLGGGTYGFSDWSFGAYGVCYGCCSASGDFNFVDVCGVVTLNDGADSYGDNWTFTSSISGDEWTIVWVNDYAGGLENGTSVITFPGGVPFTLAP